MMFEHKGLYTAKGPVPTGEHIVPFGQAALTREGRQVTVVAVANMVHKAMAAADLLAGDHISIEIIDPRTLVPLDLETILRSVAKTGRLVIADEGHLTCGVGAEIASLVGKHGFDYLDAPIERVALDQCPHPFSPPLHEALMPSAERIAAAVKETLRR
jgi:pyruvate/2-oxoglutarate/acetoin dehydrogenase E1 component